MGRFGARHARPPNGRDGGSPSDSAGSMPALPKRRKPAHGVFILPCLPTIVFLTVCTHDRQPWLSNSIVHHQLIEVWNMMDAWKVGYYLLMPDHLHLFCAPHKLEFTLKAWVAHWKRKFSCLKLKEAGRWQRDFWDTRLRCVENYHDRWEYVRQNPVRKGLISKADAWPYQGVLNELRW